MAHLTIDLPDDLAHSLEGIAAAQHTTVEQLALERLRFLVKTTVQHAPGSPAAVLNALRQPPHASEADVAALEVAIAEGSLPMRKDDPFEA